MGILHHHQCPPTSKTSVCSILRLVDVRHHHHHPSTSKTSAYARFRRWWVYCITTTTHPHRKRARMLVFEFSSCSPSPPPAQRDEEGLTSSSFCILPILTRRGGASLVVAYSRYALFFFVINQKLMMV